VPAVIWLLLYARINKRLAISVRKVQHEGSR
jgi:hypothetical protein